MHLVAMLHLEHQILSFQHPQLCMTTQSIPLQYHCFYLQIHSNGQCKDDLPPQSPTPLNYCASRTSNLSLSIRRQPAQKKPISIDSSKRLNKRLAIFLLVLAHLLVLRLHRLLRPMIGFYLLAPHVRISLRQISGPSLVWQWNRARRRIR